MTISTTTTTLCQALAAAAPGATISAPRREQLADAGAQQRGVTGTAVAAAVPRSTEAVRDVVAFAYEHDLALVPRGGGTGLAGGAVPDADSIVVDLSELAGVRSFEPHLWRMHVDAGLRTSEVRRLARENGLMFPPDPGAAEQSTIGGNIATNAGGPHALRYGTVGRWVTGIEAVVPPGEIVTLGGRLRKDVAGLDLMRLMIGSEGALGVITGAWLQLMPAPEAAYPVVALFDTAAAAGRAVVGLLAAGVEASALEFVDAPALAVAAAAFPGAAIGAATMLIAEVDGSEAEARARRAEVVEVLEAEGCVVHTPSDRRAIRELWRWRDGLSLQVAAALGGKVGEDVAVPADRLAEAVEGLHEIGRRHRLRTCSWGHAGDGNVHATFLVEVDDRDAVDRAEEAAGELFALARALGGSISGEHGIGSLKQPHLAAGMSPRVIELQREVRRAFDPKGLLNAGKVTP